MKPTASSEMIRMFGGTFSRWTEGVSGLFGFHIGNDNVTRVVYRPNNSQEYLWFKFEGKGIIPDAIAESEPHTILGQGDYAKKLTD